MLAVSDPEVPVMVSVKVPSAAVLLAVKVRMLVPIELLLVEVGFGENDAVTPLGRPVTARFTLPLNPYSG